MSEINKNVYKALETYCNLTVEPEYAVLLKGSWGCGKTHFVEEFIKQQKKKSDLKFLFVSLYGIKTVDAIEDKIFQQLNPVLSSKSMILAGKIGKGLLKGTIKLDLDDDGKTESSAKIGVPDINLSDYLTDTKNCILVFDDLERCSMELNQILGYINYFVEKDGYKVIIIADEDKLLEAESSVKKSDENIGSAALSYASIKEKLIGKTLHLDSDIDRVFDILSDKTITNEELKKEITFNKQLLTCIYKQSGYNNLRSLRKIFIEFNSFFSLLNTDIKNNSQLISHLLQIFTALSMEIYSGSISPNEIYKILGDGGFVLSLSDEAFEDETKVYKEIADKYSINFNETLIEISDWKNWFDKGIIDQENINTILNKSQYLQQQSAPEWKKLLHVFDLEQSDFEQLKEEIWQSFENFEIIDFGAIKHVVGIYLYLAEAKLIDKNSSEVATEAQEIVTQALVNNKLDIPDSLNPEDDFGSYEGFAYFSNDSKEFREFNEFFCTKIYSYQAKQRESEIPNLLKIMNNDINKFTVLMCEQSGESKSFSYKSVLDSIPVDQFIKEIESLSNANKKLICQALRMRYRNQGGSSMKAELEWINEVIDEIESKFKDSNTLDSLVMVKFAEWIKPHV